MPLISRFSSCSIFFTSLFPSLSISFFLTLPAPQCYLAGENGSMRNKKQFRSLTPNSSVFFTQAKGLILWKIKDKYTSLKIYLYYPSQCGSVGWSVSHNQKVVCLIPGQGKYLGCRLYPWFTCV